MYIVTDYKSRFLTESGWEFSHRGEVIPKQFNSLDDANAAIALNPLIFTYKHGVTHYVPIYASKIN
jgi:hypothetical protein